MGRLKSLFPSCQRDVIIGSLLGDARLECRSVGLRNPVTARLRIHHGENQKEYVFWKYSILKNLVLNGPKESTWDNLKRNLHEVSWYFHTRSTKAFGDIHGIFYRNGVKVFPVEILDYITPRALAIWFMDDGSHNENGVTLNTHGFTYEEQRYIQYFLQSRHSIPSAIVRDRTKFKIAIGRGQRKFFLKIIQSFIAPAMIYKIKSPRNDLAMHMAGVRE